MERTVPSPRVRVGALITQGESLLLVRHEKCEEDNYWLVPGGGLQYGESLEEAVLRELREEVCITDATVGRLAFAHDTIAPEGTRHLVNLYFSMDAWSGSPAIGEDPVVAEVRFIPFQEIPDLRMYPAINEPLLSYFTGGGDAAYHGRLWLDK
jgi:8-oxo-dGTP diphosphatase